MIFSVPVPSSKSSDTILTLVTNWAMWDENIVVSVNGADVLYAQANRRAFKYKGYKSPSRAFLFCYACIRCYRRVTSRNEVAA